MLTPPAPPQNPIRHRARERRLWHDETRYTKSLGCLNCPDRDVCGGLQVGRPFYHCLDLCCGNPADCDVVCRRRPAEFVKRVREVGGFSLDNVPRAPVLAVPNLPMLVPVIYHGKRRLGGFQPTVACLPLYEVIGRQRGTGRFDTPDRLREAFGLALGTPVILTGTDTDSPLERWWSMSDGRRDAIRTLRDLEVALATTPNYSLFTDQPRWDDLHSMKRIALAHEEFLSEGLPAALHVNARTDRDWQRWAAYIAARPEVTHIAFEFGTGAGWADRIGWHAEQLGRLAARVDRPLHLTVRGGKRALPSLLAAFDSLTLLETSAFVKAMKRQRARLESGGGVSWHPAPTPVEVPLDELLAVNWSIVSRSFISEFDLKTARRIAG